MDNAFQELDYSDISAKNLNKKNRNISGINTKTRGGIIRLGSMLIISIIIIIMIITLISKYNSLSNRQNELEKIKAEILEKEKEISLEEEKHNYLFHDITDAQRNKDGLYKQKHDLENDIQNLENLKKRSENDILNAKEAISLLEGKLKEFEEIKKKIDDLQNKVDYYHNEIEKLKNK